MSNTKAQMIIGLIGQFGPQILAFTKFAPIASSVASAMQTAQAFIQQDGESQEDLNARRLAAVLAEGQTAAAAVNAQAGKVLIDPAEVGTLGAGIIGQVKAAVNLVHDVHANTTTGNPAAVAIPTTQATATAIANGAVGSAAGTTAG